MNWLKILMNILSLTPTVVSSVEQIHAGAGSSTKKQMAMESLKLATGVATSILPERQPAIDAATQLTSNVIDGVVATLNAAGIFKHKTNTPNQSVKIGFIPAK
jgi:hypothetical protein